ncbi:hypothetical protein NC652_035508 [Populus alba x Populus x berolinensis]|nr:hypothetical protein NC652_035508 [Populus alba x Populus x berolinensis]
MRFKDRLLTRSKDSTDRDPWDQGQK